MVLMFEKPKFSKTKKNETTNFVQIDHKTFLLNNENFSLGNLAKTACILNNWISSPDLILEIGKRNFKCRKIISFLHLLFSKRCKNEMIFRHFKFRLPILSIY